MTFRIANRSRALLSGKAAVQLTPEKFAAILAAGDSASIGDDLDCLTEHGVTVKDREAAIAVKAQAEATAKAEAEKAAAAKAAADEAARAAQAKELAEAKAAAEKMAAEKVEAEKKAAEAQASAKAAADQLANAQAAVPPPAAAQAATKAPVPATPAVAPPAPAATDETPESDPKPEDGEAEAGPSDRGDDTGDWEDPGSDHCEEDENEDTDSLEAVMEDFRAVIARAAALPVDDLHSFYDYFKKVHAAFESDLVASRQAVAA